MDSITNIMMISDAIKTLAEASMFCTGRVKEKVDKNIDRLNTLIVSEISDHRYGKKKQSKIELQKVVAINEKAS